MNDIDKIKSLIESGNEDNFDLAFLLLKGLGIDENEFMNEHYSYLDLVNKWNLGNSKTLKPLLKIHSKTGYLKNKKK